MPPPVSVSTNTPTGSHGSGLIICHWRCPVEQHTNDENTTTTPLLLHPRWSSQVKAVISAVGSVKDVGFVQGWGGNSFAATFRATHPEMIPAFLCAFQELKRRLHKASAMAHYESGNYAAQLDPFGVLDSGSKADSTPPPPPPQILTLDSFGIIDETVASGMKRMRVGLPVGGKRSREEEDATVNGAASQSLPSSGGPSITTTTMTTKFPFIPTNKATSMLCLIIEDIRGGNTSNGGSEGELPSSAPASYSSSWTALAAARGIITRYLSPMAEAMGRIPNRSILDILEGQTVPGERGAANLGELFQLKYMYTPQEQMKVLDRYQMAAAALFERVFFYIAPPRADGGAARLFLMFPPDYSGSEQLLSIVKQQLESTFAVLGKKPESFEDGLQVVGDGVLPAMAYSRSRVHTISILQFFTALQKV